MHAFEDDGGRGVQPHSRFLSPPCPCMRALRVAGCNRRLRLQKKAGVTALLAHRPDGARAGRLSRPTGTPSRPRRCWSTRAGTHWIASRPWRSPCMRGQAVKARLADAIGNCLHAHIEGLEQRRCWSLRCLLTHRGGSVVVLEPPEGAPRGLVGGVGVLSTRTLPVACSATTLGRGRRAGTARIPRRRLPSWRSLLRGRGWQWRSRRLARCVGRRVGPARLVRATAGA